MSDSGRIVVNVKYRDAEQTFSGSVEDVGRASAGFLGSFCPLLRLLRGLS